MVNATLYPYNIHNISSSNNILEFVQGVNHLTNSYFMLGILFVGFIILFTSMKTQLVSNKDALTVSGFITAVMAILFFTLSFISSTWLIFIIIVCALVVVLTTLRGT